MNISNREELAAALKQIIDKQLKDAAMRRCGEKIRHIGKAHPRW